MLADIRPSPTWYASGVLPDVTLKQGIEKTMMGRIPEVTAVRDATDHSTGSAPYIARG